MDQVFQFNIKFHTKISIVSTFYKICYTVVNCRPCMIITLQLMYQNLFEMFVHLLFLFYYVFLAFFRIQLVNIGKIKLIKLVQFSEKEEKLEIINFYKS